MEFILLVHLKNTNVSLLAQLSSLTPGLVTLHYTQLSLLFLKAVGLYRKAVYSRPEKVTCDPVITGH